MSIYNLEDYSTISDNDKYTLINRYINDYKDVIEVGNFEDEIMLYEKSYRNLIREMFDIVNVEIFLYKKYTEIRFDYFNIIISNGDITIQVSPSENTYSDEFKEIYHRLIEIETLINKDAIITYDKTMRIVEANHDNIYDTIHKYFKDTKSTNINGLERELKLKYIELI